MGRTERESNNERIANLEAAVKQLEAALRETRERLNAVLQVTPAAATVPMLEPLVIE
jgi:hypothetical protein